MNKTLYFGMTVLVALGLVASPVSADARLFSKKKNKAETAQVDTTKKKLSKYDKLFKGETSCQKGMISLHLKGGKVYFELPNALLGREFIMGSTITSISDNGNGVVGSKDGLKHFTFVKVDSTIQMRSLNTDYVADDECIERALSKSRTGFIEKSFKIAALSNDSTAVVFDATPVFLEHNKETSPFLELSPFSSYTREETFKPELSYIAGIKAFEDNVSVSSSMSYTYNMKRGDRTVYKNRPLTAVLTRSIVLLPEEIYHPRMADYRIGVFFSGRTQFGANTGSTRDVYLAHRWRLEPSDTAAFRSGQCVAPKKQIVWYVDNNFPEWWRPYIFEAVEQWNEVFAEIGFKDVLVAKPFPTDDPEFDPDNIKYNCIRYAPIGVRNATGPSWVDPRSGEIINAAVYVYHDIIKLITDWRFIQTSQADPDARASELSKEVLGDALRYVITHEIGHTLGLMHNMSGSSVIPVESLRDPEFTRENGTTTSIMDYARFNYVAQPGDKERGVAMTPPRFGHYDHWAIKWAYTPVFDAESFEQEAAITSQWITDAVKADPWCRYGKQQFSTAFYDPRSQMEDLGDDAVAATRYGVKSLKEVMKNFMDWGAEGDEEFEFRTDIYNGIINQYVMYAQHVLLNVGGLYKNEIKQGDELPAFANVPAAKQKEALSYMFELWKDTAWMADRSVVGRLPVYGSPEAAVRSAVENMILMAPMLASSSDGISTREFSSKECFRAISDKVFASTKKGARLSAEERSFQSNFVMTYLSAGGFAIPGAKNNSFAPEPMIHRHFCSLAESEAVDFGYVAYNPVGGYEWVPRSIFNRGDVTKATLYAVLTDVRDLMKSRVASANADDKAHYQTLIDAIDYSLKK